MRHAILAAMILAATIAVAGVQDGPDGFPLPLEVRVDGQSWCGVATTSGPYFNKGECPALPDMSIVLHDGQMMEVRRYFQGAEATIVMWSSVQAIQDGPDGFPLPALFRSGNTYWRAFARDGYVTWSVTDDINPFAVSDDPDVGGGTYQQGIIIEDPTPFGPNLACDFCTLYLDGECERYQMVETPKVNGSYVPTTFGVGDGCESVSLNVGEDGRGACSCSCPVWGGSMTLAASCKNPPPPPPSIASN